MNENDLKDIPASVPLVVHKRILNAVYQNTNESADQPIAQHRRKYAGRKTVVFSLVAVMLLGTTAFAATKYYQIRVSQEGYKSELHVEKKEGETAVQKFAEYSNIAVHLDYIPANFTTKDEGLKFGYDGQGVTICLFQFGSATSTSITSTFTKDVKKVELAPGSTGYIVSKYTLGDDVKAYGRNCYIFFDDSPYFILLYMTNGISDADVEQVMRNCRIEGTNEASLGQTLVVAKDNIQSYEKTNASTGTSGRVAVAVATKDDFDGFAQVGDTINAYGVKYTLKSFRYVDQLEGFDSQYFSKDFSAMFDAGGNPVPYDVKVVKRGDGVNTLNEIVEEKQIKQRFLVVELTATNEAFFSEEVQIAGRLLRDNENTGAVDTYEIRTNGIGEQNYPFYNDHCKNTIKSFYMAEIPHGETIEYTLIYALGEDQTSHTGLSFYHGDSRQKPAGYYFDVREQ